MPSFNPFEQTGDNQTFTITVTDKDFEKTVTFPLFLNSTERMLEQTLENARKAIDKPAEDLRVIVWEQKRVQHFNKFKHL